MQNITLQEVMEAGRKFYAEGTLTAQHPNPSLRACVYRMEHSPQYRCVVGAAMNSETFAHPSCEGSVRDLVHYKVITVPTGDLNAITQLQIAHDDWCSAISKNDREKCEKKFCQLMDIPYDEKA